MSRDPIQLRRERYSQLSSQIAQMDTVKLQSLLDRGETQRGWGRTQLLEIGQSKVFLKRVPITDLEYENQFSTKNLYDLPMFYNYGVGSAGFGVFRELVTHIKTTNWVLEGAIATFPLMYHYRILPTVGARAEIDPEQHQKYVGYWDSNENIGRYILDRAKANYEAMIFLEYIPYTVGKWLSENTSKVDALVAEMRDTITFLRTRGILHLDVHFHNIVTDGKRFYLTDFGLALDKNFDLTSAEQAFYARNTEYDYGELLSSLGSHLAHMCRDELSEPEKSHLSDNYGITEKIEFEDLLSVLVDRSAEIHADALLNIDRRCLVTIAKYRSVLILMHRFYSEMWRNNKKDTRFENAKLRKLLLETGFLPVAARVDGR